MESRKLSPTAYELRVQAYEALDSMENMQEQAFKCGPFAIFRIRHTMGLPEPLHPLIEKEESTLRGTNMSQLVDLTKRIGMPMQAVEVSAEKPIPVPSVVYWNLGHYSAITGMNRNGDYIVRIPRFQTPSTSERMWCGRS